MNFLCAKLLAIVKSLAQRKCQGVKRYTKYMESQSIEKQLEELRSLVNENNRLLKAMRRDALIGGIVKFVVWAGLLAVSYYFTIQFIGPYLSALQGMQGSGQGQDLNALFEQYRGFLGE